MYNKDNHKKVIIEFLDYINSQTSEYILKGGTSLMLCYGLNRFSEDIDLDCSKKESFIDHIEQFCKTKKYEYRIAKNTDTVQRAMIHYDNSNKPLKIEVSYRNKVINQESVTMINNYSVYTLDRIATMKTQAYLQRDKIRDLYDICFIVNNKFDQLSSYTKMIIQDAFGQKGLEQYDYVVQQDDELINKKQLANDMLDAFEKLDLLVYNKDNQKVSEETKSNVVSLDKK